MADHVDVVQEKAYNKSTSYCRTCCLNVWTK